MAGTKSQRERGNRRVAPTLYICLVSLYERGRLYERGDEIMLTPDRAEELRGVIRAPEDKMMRFYETK